MDFVRKMVSKKKRRFEWGNFDLDLTYITDRIIAMGFPSESIEGLYRNNMKDVIRFFNTLHPGHYKVINLCSERNYTHDKFENNVSEYPFDDHNPPPLDMIAKFCKDVEDWLDRDPENVVAIHCKAGKGRTGTMIACWLLYSRTCQTGSESIRMFGNKRTHNGKGITIPSQARYVRYFEALLQYGLPIQQAPNNITKILSSIRLNPLPNFNMAGGCEPYISIGQRDKSVYYTKPMKIKKGTQIVEIDCGNIILTSDVKIQFYNRNSKGHMFSFCFHTAFVDGTSMLIRRTEIDKAHKDSTHKHFHPNFTIELIFCEDLEELINEEQDEFMSEDLTNSTSSTSPISPDTTSKNNNNNNHFEPNSTLVGTTTFSTGLAKLYSGAPKSELFNQHPQQQQSTNDSSSTSTDTVTKKSTLRNSNNDNNNNKGNSGQFERKISASQQVLTCPKCNLLISAEDASINDGKFNYHWKCLTCNQCRKSLDKESHCLFQQGGEMLCIDCSSGDKGGFFNICAACNQVIKTSDFEEVGEVLFHQSCFLCHLCDTFLSGNKFIIKPDKRLECSKCLEKNNHLHQIPKQISIKEEKKEEKIEEEPTSPMVEVVPDSSGRKEEFIITKLPTNSIEERRSSIIKCQKCLESVGLRPLILDIGVWHKHCFSCSLCDSLIDTSIYFIKDEKPICSECDKKDRASQEEYFCCACKLQIKDELMEALGEKWHVHCLVCVYCKCQIDGPFGDNNGFIYCKEHYEEMFGTKCDECQLLIVGTFLKVGNKQLHSHCFKCSNCNNILEGGRYYSKGDCILCEDCRHTDIQKRKTQIQMQMIGIRNSIHNPSSSSNLGRSQSPPLNSSIDSTTQQSTVLFHQRFDPTRQSVRVNLNDLHRLSQWEQNRPDQKGRAGGLHNYPSFHRQMQKNINQNNGNSNNKTFKPANPKKIGTLRRDFLQQNQQIFQNTI